MPVCWPKQQPGASKEYYKLACNIASKYREIDMRTEWQTDPESTLECLIQELW